MRRHDFEVHPPILRVIAGTKFMPVSGLLYISRYKYDLTAHIVSTVESVAGRTRNLAIANRSRSASYNNPSVEYDSRNM